jgi:hypothetical protein
MYVLSTCNLLLIFVSSFSSSGYDGTGGCNVICLVKLCDFGGAVVGVELSHPLSHARISSPVSNIRC